jgi:tRNA dimethylallyltransferase
MARKHSAVFKLTMSNTKNKYLIVVLGPTASGKTALAVDIAKAFNTEVVSADSRQFYKEMKIGTARPSDEELQGVPHHLLGHISVNNSYNAGNFEKEALTILDTIYKKSNIAVLCGGSGMYVNALCYGMDELPEQDENVRDELILLYKEKGIEGLQEKLKILDPDYYHQVDICNPQRLMRALEVCIISGKPYSKLREGKKKERDFNIIKIGIDRSREDLYKRINARVDLMFEQGLLDEVEKLQEFQHLNALQTVGYSELFEYLKGNCSIEQAKENIKQNTRRFAKRQLTWYRRDTEINWFKPNETNSVVHFIKEKIHA